MTAAKGGITSDLPRTQLCTALLRRDMPQACAVLTGYDLADHVVHMHAYDYSSKAHSFQTQVVVRVSNKDGSAARWAALLAYVMG